MTNIQKSITRLDVSSGQYRLMAEMMGNVAVAWFVAGVISPLYLGFKDLVVFTALLLSGLAGSSVFAVLALMLTREGENGKN